MGGAMCCENKEFKVNFKRQKPRVSNSIFELDNDSITIDNTKLTLIPQDLYKFNQQTKVDCIFNIQDCNLEFTDKTFKIHVGESVVKECASFIKLNEDLSLNNVMYTKGGNANCKYIIHGCFKKDSSVENDAENFRILISETLKQASNILKCRSILFPLHQLKTNCSKICLSIILACQNFINENSPINIKSIYFVGDDEDTIELYRKALNANQRIRIREDTYLSCDSNNINKDKILQFDSPDLFEKTERGQSKNVYQQNQLDLLETPGKQQISVLKSQNRSNSNQQSEGNEQFNSQRNRSALKLLKNYQDDYGNRCDEVKTQGDLDISRNERTHSERYSINNINNKRSSLGSGINKEFVNDKQKLPQKPQKTQLNNYKTPFQQVFNLDEQHQLQRDLNKKNNTNKKRNLKSELLSTNITQTRDDEDSLDKDKYQQEDEKYGSFSSDMESSEQITFINNLQNQNQCQDSLLNKSLNLNQESHDPNYLSSNIQSNRFISII